MLAVRKMIGGALVGLGLSGLVGGYVAIQPSLSFSVPNGAKHVALKEPLLFQGRGLLVHWQLVKVLASDLTGHAKSVTFKLLHHKVLLTAGLQANTTYTLQFVASGLGGMVPYHYVFTTIHKPVLQSGQSLMLTYGGHITLHFSQPIASVRVRWNGKHTLQKQISGQNVILRPKQYKQGETRILQVSQVVAKNGQKGLSTVKVIRVSVPKSLYVATRPGPDRMAVSRHTPITFNFSTAVSAKNVSRFVKFQPALQGSWQQTSGKVVSFIPQKPFHSTETIQFNLKGGVHGLRGNNGAFLPVSSIQRLFITQSNELITVSESLPEKLVLYKNGKPILTTLVNTGIKGAITPVGHYYVETKLPRVNMRGTDPNGQKYFAPNVRWVLPVIGNVAIHGYSRAHYGFPQSAGCIELPISQAKKLYGLVKVGTPVVIQKAPIRSFIQVTAKG